MQRILCPTDFSTSSTKAQAYAEQLAVWTGAELLLLHAFDTPATATYEDVQNPADPAIAQQLQSLPLHFSDTKAERVLHVGPPGEVICWLAEHRCCDLIVMGTHGRTGLKHLVLGSVAEYVMRHARCPVLTVADRPPDEAPLREPVVLPVKAPRFM